MAALPRPPLVKSKSWSPDILREESWQRRRDLHRERRRSGAPCRSVTAEDLDELRGCIDLGFCFSLEEEQCRSESAKLFETLPALDLYYAVNRRAERAPESDSDVSSAGTSPLSFYAPGDNPQKVKERLKQWAQIVACSVRQQY